MCLLDFETEEFNFDLSLSSFGEKMKSEGRWLQVEEWMGGEKVSMKVNTNLRSAGITMKKERGDRELDIRLREGFNF